MTLVALNIFTNILSNIFFPFFLSRLAVLTDSECRSVAFYVYNKTWKTFVTNAVNIIFFLNHPTTMTIHTQIERVDIHNVSERRKERKSDANANVCVCVCIFTSLCHAQRNRL